MPNIDNFPIQTNFKIQAKKVISSKLSNQISAVLMLLSLLLFGSCTTNTDEDLSDRVGFDNSSMMQPPQARTSGDYYYRQGMPNQEIQGQGNVGANPYGNFNSRTNTPYQYQQNPYQQQYYQAPPYVAAPYQVAPGASRYYSNPYSIPPSPYYPQFDADQYYVPPRNADLGEDQQQFNNRR